MKHRIMVPIAAGLSVGLVATLVFGEDQPHAEYLSASTVTSNIAASGGFFSNASPQIVTYNYHPAPVSLEQLLPHDQLVVQTKALATPPQADRSCAPISRTGPDPFFLRRQHPSRAELLAPKLAPFWCSSFQKFRARMVTRHGRLT
jgi:hypothetical protein